MKLRVIETFNPGNNHRHWHIERYVGWAFGWQMVSGAYCISPDEVERKLAQLQRYGHLDAIKKVVQEIE